MNARRKIVGWLGCISVLGVGVAVSPRAEAHPSYGSVFVARYPTTTLPTQMFTLTGSNCNVCHDVNTSRAAAATCYKRDLSVRIAAGRTITQAIDDIDSWDSDGDGVSNGGEITAPRNDGTGAVGFHPGLIGLGTDPCGTNTTLVITNRRETPCRADFNNSGGLTVQDIFDFLNAWFAGAAAADFDGANGLQVQDIFAYLNAWFAGC
jgi:hypothetical protein